MKIGIDLDDVIVNFSESLMDFHGKKYGKRVDLEEIKECKWWLYWDTTKEEAIKRADDFHESHNVEEVMSIKEAIPSLNKIIKENKVFIITSRPSRFKPKVEQWLQYHLKQKLEVIHAGDFHKD